MTHVRTSPFYPQSNGKDRTLAPIAQRGVHPAGTPLSLDGARRLVQSYVDHYNDVRLNSATRYITPKDMLAGRRQEIHAERDPKLEAARRQTTDSSPASRLTYRRPRCAPCPGPPGPDIAIRLPTSWLVIIQENRFFFGIAQRYPERT